jgi:hypothetical protein
VVGLFKIGSRSDGPGEHARLGMRVKLTDHGLSKSIFGLFAPKQKRVFVLNQPFELLAFLDLLGLCQSGWKVDIIRLRRSSLEPLDFLSSAPFQSSNLIEFILLSSDEVVRYAMAFPVTLLSARKSAHVSARGKFLGKSIG